MTTPAKRISATPTQASPPSSGLVALSQAQQDIDMPFLPGEVIAGKYEVQKLIGSGGMGYVVSAMHVELGEVVALKFLRPEALAIDELVERFAREARAAAKIRSEHVARVFDVGSLPDGVPFIVMEHLDGQDLCDVLNQRGPLPIKVAVEYVMQACEALAAAHAAGVVHRDIKPENLFLTRHAQGLDFIKILDFGISKVALQPGKRAFVRTQMPLGSPVYMSPEQIRSSEHVDARTDIWSLGCVLFELITGVCAFNEPTLMQLSASILEHDPVPLREFLPDAPVELEAVILRCLEKDVNKRYGNVAELAIALYPFAPRRSRISAERCYHALKNAGIDCPEFEIASVYPPSIGEIPLLSSTQPVSGVMSAHSQRTSRAAVPSFGNSALPTIITPISAGTPSTSTRDELASMRPAFKFKRFGWIALGALSAAACYFLLQARAPVVTGTPVPAVLSASAPSVAVAGTVPNVEPKAPAPDPNLHAATEGSASSQASATPTAHAEQGQNHTNYHYRPPPVVKTTTAPHHHGEGDEIDVGY